MLGSGSRRTADIFWRPIPEDQSSSERRHRHAAVRTSMAGIEVAVLSATILTVPLQPGADDQGGGHR
jgi:hypothetical protein